MRPSEGELPSDRCTCHHYLDDHPNGPCAGKDGYGLPCECPSFEPCPCGGYVAEED